MKQIVHVWPPDVYAVKAAEELIRVLKIDYRQGTPVSVALSGGTTPEPVYRHLRILLQNDPALSRDIRWFQADERNVSPEDAQSNQRLIRHSLIANHIQSQSPFYAVSVQDQNPAQTATEYENTLRTHLPENDTHASIFDLVLLGVGEDGHTASLFPECDWQNGQGRTFREFWVEKLKTWRYSLTLDALLAAKKIVFLGNGSKKATLLKKILALRGFDLPAGRLAILRDTQWWLDSEAARELKP